MSHLFDITDTSDESTLATGSPARIQSAGDHALADLYATLGLLLWESC